MTSTDYLRIEPYLQDAMQARVLQAAFDAGVIDVLENNDEVQESILSRNRPIDQAGRVFLIQMLNKSGVVTQRGHFVSLTSEFRAALKYRDLLLTKLHFSEIVAADFFSRLPQLLSSSEEFMETSKLFELFDYGRCLQVNPQNCLQAARWMKLTTMLTRYESPVCADHFAFSEHQRMLDLGGNSGEFALQICRRAPTLRATVVDLPVVCHVGTNHVAEFPEASRIHFEARHVIDDDFPDAHDLITCKSILHDWPDEAVRTITEKAMNALPSGGRFLIFERRKWDFSEETMAYGLLPLMLFFRSYRPTEFYTELLEATGFINIESQVIPLEVPFLLVTGQKK